MMKFFALAAVIMVAGSGSFAGDPSIVMKQEFQERFLTGNARVDLMDAPSMPAPAMPTLQSYENHSRKSPWLAAGLSAVVPGAGEFYAESYWKAAAFLAVEIAVWSIAYSYDKRGDRQTNLYQDFANQNWSVVRYAQYALENLVPSASRDYYMQNLWIPGSEGRAPWERVNWAVLNQMEREIGRTAAGQYYSHTLPPHGDQQYYEMIGKYQQYNQGWNDAPSTYNYPDPVTPNFLFYSRERGKANDYYATASTAVTIGILNHILSALDAAWSASTYNKRFEARVGLQSVPVGYGAVRVPVAKLSYIF